MHNTNNNGSYPMTMNNENATNNGDNTAPPAGGYNFAPIGTGGTQQPMYSSPTGPYNSTNNSSGGVPPPSTTYPSGI